MTALDKRRGRELASSMNETLRKQTLLIEPRSLIIKPAMKPAAIAIIKAQATN